MSSKILTVSNINSTTSSEDNAEILTTFNPPIDIKNDTLLNFKTGFIDVVGLGNTGEDIFKVNTPINATIEFSYYEQFVDSTYSSPKYEFTTGTEFTSSNADQPYGPQYLGITYALYQFVTKPDKRKSEPFVFGEIDHYDEINLIKSNVNVVVNEGSYTSDSIVEYLNIALQSVPKLGLAYSPKQYGSTFEDSMDNFPQYIPFDRLVKQYSESEDNGTFGKFLVFVAVTQSPIFFPPANTGPYEPPRQDNEAFYAYTYSHGSSGNKPIPDILIGTPFFSLENTEDLLRFSYTHNPYYTTASRVQTIELNKIPQFVSTAFDQTSYMWFTKRGGINICDMQPRNFWFDLLGFDETTLLNINNVNISDCNVDIFNLLGPSSFDYTTTRPFIGIADFDAATASLTNTEYKELTQSFNVTVNNTVGINAVNAINYSDLDNGGHLLLQCEIGSKMNNFFDSDTLKLDLDFWVYPDLAMPNSIVDSAS